LPFDESSVITESRLSAAEFLGDAPIEHVLQPRADLGTVLDPAQYTSPEAALAAWVPVFFPDVPLPPMSEIKSSTCSWEHCSRGICCSPT
jgi:DEAD/DEAH box helicase domain-containing protein